jgi:hypothetical protein
VVVTTKERVSLADCVAKLENFPATNFRQKTKRAAIDNSYSLGRVTEVAGEFILK